jgi:APA family basic amino acid/polyamine antiporter
VLGITVGSGIFRTPGLVAAQLGRPALIFAAWVLGGVVALLGVLVFAELTTRHPHAGGKYVFARESHGRRAAFVVGWVEALGIYAAVIAALGVVSGEYLARLLGWPASRAALLGVLWIAGFTALNLLGVAMTRWVQNLVTLAKVLALAVVVLAAGIRGTGTGWEASTASAPNGWAAVIGLGLAFQSLIWTYYGYVDLAKIAEEISDPDRRLPRILFFGIGATIVLYLLLNASFLQVLPLERIADSNLVAGDVVQQIFGERAGGIMAGLALLVVLSGLNGNVFVTPRVFFGMARDGLAPGALARVSAGGSPWTATLLVGAVASALAASGTFEWLLSLTIILVLAIDGFMVPVLFRLRRRSEPAPFRVPLYPFLPLLFLSIYAALFLAALVGQPATTALALGVIAAAYALSRLVVR